MQRHHAVWALVQQMLELATLTDSTESFGWTGPSRKIALEASQALRHDAQRLLQRVPAASPQHLRTIRQRTSRLRHSLHEMSRLEVRLGEIRMQPEARSGSARETVVGFEQRLHQARVSLSQLLEVQRNRAPYEDLAEALRACSDRMSGPVLELLPRLEKRLEAGHFDYPREEFHGELAEYLARRFEAA